MRTKNPLLVLAVWVLFIQAVRAQTYPQNYFIKPIDTALYLSGTYGSLRENHFHSGMDIRTYEKEGFPVRASADGYIVRIKVSPNGYGKALYINHPNGFTTQYGHLQRFNDSLTAITRQHQFRNESFDVDFFMEVSEYLVKKGDTIGYSGNSGGSSGPHLHFEIRHTVSEEILDPRLFGNMFQDTLPPRIYNIFLFNLDRESKKRLGFNIPAVPLKPQWRINRQDTVELPFGTYGIAAQMEEFMLISDWGLGCNNFYLKVNGQVVYRCDIDRFAFDQTRYVNNHIDYRTYKTARLRLHKLFLDYGTKAPFYSGLFNRGMISLTDSTPQHITIVATDRVGFTDSFAFYLKGRYIPEKPVEKIPPARVLFPGRKESITEPHARLSFSPSDLYDTLYVSYQERKTRSGFNHRFNNSYIPLHTSAELNLKVVTPPKGSQRQWCIAQVRPDGSVRYAGGKFRDGWISTSIRELGEYTLASDIKAPVIKPLSPRLKKQQSSDSLIAFSLSDDFSGIGTYRCTLDGQWLLMDWDPKNGWLAGYLPALLPGAHELELEVADNRGNTSRFKTQIIKP